MVSSATVAELARRNIGYILGTRDRRDELVQQALIDDHRVFFPAFSVTEARSVIQSQLAPDERTAFAQNMLAAVLAMASYETVLTHTGNVGACTALYRGGAKTFSRSMPGAHSWPRLQPPESCWGCRGTGAPLLGTWMFQSATAPIVTVTRHRGTT